MKLYGDTLEDRRMYCITNYPLTDGNYIQNGAAHTLLGMQYGNLKYGSQLDFGLNQVKYRRLVDGTWQGWETLSNLVRNADEYSNFNNMKVSGIYKFGGTNITNKPTQAWGVVEVINADGYILQRVTGLAQLAVRYSWDNGSNWSNWAYFYPTT